MSASALRRARTPGVARPSQGLLQQLRRLFRAARGGPSLGLEEGGVVQEPPEAVHTRAELLRVQNESLSRFDHFPQNFFRGSKNCPGWRTNLSLPSSTSYGANRAVRPHDRLVHK
eukprot:CAMPEP_0204493012 /NCGR_PEP_ID=MMETSP0471-20130131/81056_1 /ASSEMBLY_ACC=CAM_ASM_000602 /TAXON_ID=2969 /ORGANISM="Oxyrrhis marina" /LENGTH=114 /DNA_ID=CAMNT_0051497117 /DNA_START=51 /DNA_END=396 /DNA_ORIENTATION=+